MTINKSPGRPPVLVVVLNYNGQAVNEACLASLAASDYPNLRVCLVDNASTDGSPEWVEEHHPEVTVLRCGVNKGWSGANNEGVRHGLEVGAEFIWLLNNDVEVEPDCVSQLVTHAEANPSQAILGPVIHYHEPREKIWFQGGLINFGAFRAEHAESLESFRKAPSRARFISGCALFVRRDVFESIGLIDERFFIYFEDTDFCVRSARAGFELEVVEAARMYHKVSAFSGGAEEPSPWRTYYVLRSGLLFWRKHLGWWAFHRAYCASQLGKWFANPSYASETGLTEWGGAVADALWYFLSGSKQMRSWPRAPAWFRRLMGRRPWVVAQLMSLRLPGTLFGPRT